jgi:hypothetical protein
MKKDKGIDYGMGMANINHATGIRYGVIHQHEVLQAWADSSEADYGIPDKDYCCGYCRNDFQLPDGTECGDMVTCPHCDEESEIEADMTDPICFYVDDGEYSASSDSYGDIFITRSLYYTFCAFCSPCAPGAGYLMSIRDKETGIKAYCFGHEWFDDGKAPYTVYSVKTGEIVKPN